MARVRRTLVWVGAGLVGGAALLLGLGWLLVQTQPGHDFLLRVTLQQLPRYVDGEIEIGGLRSEGLLRGFTLKEVAVRDDRGRPFVEADSLSLRYSLRGLIRREIALAPVEVWSPRVTIEAMHGDERWNAERIFLPEEPDAPTDLGLEEEDREGGVSLILRSARVHDGDVLIRRPVEPGHAGERGSARVEPAPEGEGEVHTLRFTDVDATLAAADLVDDEVEGQRFRIDALSLTGHVLDEPFRLVDLRGDVVREGSTVSLRFDRMDLPGSELAGSVLVDWSDEIVLDGDVHASTLDFEDLRWIEPRLPSGGGTMALRVAGPLDRADVRISDADLQAGVSQVRGDVGIELGEPWRLTETEVEFPSFQLDLIEPWLDEPLPVEGRLQGRLAADGPPAALHVDGTVTYDDPARGVPASTATLDGTLRLDEGVGATGLTVHLDPFDYETLDAFVPELAVRGTGRVEGEVSGGLAEGLDLTAHVEHATEGLPRSVFTVTGEVRADTDDLRLALGADLESVSLDGIAGGLGLELPLRGTVAGPLRAEGPLGSLSVSGRLDTGTGVVEADTRFDVRAPLDGYRAEGAVEALDLHALLPDVPEETVLTGEFRVDGRGAEPEELAGEASLSLLSSTVAGAEVDLLSTRLRAEGGRLAVEDLEAVAAAARITGGGDLALRDGEPEGEVVVLWEVDSLGELAAAWPGFEAPVPEAEVPTEPGFFGLEEDEEAAVAGGTRGSGQGELRLQGGLADLSVDGHVEVVDLAYGTTVVDRGRSDFVGRWAAEHDWEVEGAFDLEGVEVDGYAFRGTSGEIAYQPGAGAFRLDVRRGGAERYGAAGVFEYGDDLVDVALNSLAFELEDVTWALEEPTRIFVSGRSVDVADLRIVRGPEDEGGERELRIEVGGLLDLEGNSDFGVAFSDVDVDRLGRILQMDNLPSGRLDLRLDVDGPAQAPRIAGDLSVRDFAFDGTGLSRVEGSVFYEDRLLEASLQGDLGDRTPLSIEGRVPMDLAFHEVADRFPEREIDVTLGVEGLPAETALGFLDPLEDLDGTLEGELRLTGRPDELEPTGELRLRGGGVHLSGVGLRSSDIVADLRLHPDRTVEVIAEAGAGGEAHVLGTIALEELTDPEFDLEVVANDFQAVQRRDLAARVGGTVQLTGNYTAPRVTGDVRVAQGELFLEEAARTAEVVDLADPAFFDVVDTTLVAVRPTIEAAQNPFLRNLVVDVDLDIPREFWLRSAEMDAEIAGELAVSFERPTGEVVLAGTLEPVRGSYTAFGRQFQVQEGTVEFPGTPGIDPALNLEAVHRLRRAGGEPLDITAHVEGTLTSPTVRLSTDAQPEIAESDLISYLLFGRPSYALGSGEMSMLEGAEQAAVTMGLGTVATQLGSVVARQFGVDYFAITQAQDPEGLATAVGRSQFAHTQIEVGQYVGNNLFLALILRPLTGLGATAQSQVPGARLEWRFADTWLMEGFVEDRFAREGASRFGDAGVSQSQVFGLSILREWGF